MLVRIKMLPTFSLALLTTLAIGCGGTTEEVTPVQEADVEAAHNEAAASEHVHTAPHGGELIPLGEHEYNVELVFEDGDLNAYILGGHAEKKIGLPLESFDFDQEVDGDEIEITLTANPQDGDEEGMASRYTAKADALPEGIKSLDDLEGHVHISIEGKNYNGDLGEHAHEGEGHDEDKEGDHKEDGDAHDEDKDGQHEKDGDKGHKDGEHKDGDTDENKAEKKESTADAPEADSKDDKPEETESVE